MTHAQAEIPLGFSERKRYEMTTVENLHLPRWEREFESPIPPHCVVRFENSCVAGTSHRKRACIRFAKGMHLTLELQKEPDNEHDPNALAVLGRFNEGTNIYQAKLGYVRRGLAEILANEEWRVLPRLRLVQIKGEFVFVYFDLLVVEDGQEAPSFLPGQNGSAKEIEPEILPDDADVKQLVTSMKLHGTIDQELLATVAHLQNCVKEESERLSEIENFDIDEFLELEGEELEDFSEEFDDWLLDLAAKPGFEELQGFASDVLTSVEDAVHSASSFLKGEFTLGYFAYEIARGIVEIEDELLDDREMPKDCAALLEKTLKAMDNVLSLIVSDNVTWRRLFAEKERREAPQRLAALKEILKALEEN